MSKIYEWETLPQILAMGDDRVQVNIVGIIGSEKGWSETWFERLDELIRHKKELVISINSRGGDAFVAAEIFDRLMALKGVITIKTEIYGVCASAATLIALAGDEVAMGAAARWMVHEPQTVAAGGLSKIASTLQNLEAIWQQMLGVYAAKTGKTVEELRAAIDGDTFFSASEALAFGWVDRVIGAAVQSPELEPVQALAAEQEAAAKLGVIGRVKALFGLRAEAEETETLARVEALMVSEADLRQQIASVEAERAGMLATVEAVGAENAAVRASLEKEVVRRVAALGLGAAELPSAEPEAGRESELASLSNVQLMAEGVRNPEARKELEKRVMTTNNNNK